MTGADPLRSGVVAPTDRGEIDVGHITARSRTTGGAPLLVRLGASLFVVMLLSIGLVQPAAAATSHTYQWANGTSSLTASPGDVVEVDLTISGCDDGTVINGQGFTLLGWIGAYERQLPVAPGYPNGTASYGPNWPLVTVAPTPLENTTYRIPFQIPEDQALGATTFRMTNFQGVSCSSSGGVGADISLTIVAAEEPTAAGPPTDLAGTPGDGQVALSWSAPADDGGSPVTGYRMEFSTSPGGPFSGAFSDCDAPGIGMSTSTSCTAGGLANGTQYYFRALTFNDVGPGPWSSVAGPFVPVPPAPATPAAPTATAGDAAATVTVSEPGSGSAPEKYLVTSDPGGRTCTVTGTSGSCTVTGLQNGVAHTFTATATNAGGTSAESDPSAPVTPSAPAPSPTVPPTTAPPSSEQPTSGPADGSAPDRDGPRLALSMDLRAGTAAGDPVNTIGVEGEGLLPGSTFTVTMFSAPRLLGSGIVGADGSLATTVSLPGDTEPGSHSVVVAAESAEGPVTATGWFSVDREGRIVAVSDTGPVPDPTAAASGAAGAAPASGQLPGTLAFTGSDETLLALALVLLTAGAALSLVGRRLRVVR